MQKENHSPLSCLPLYAFCEKRSYLKTKIVRLKNTKRKCIDSILNYRRGKDLKKESFKKGEVAFDSFPFPPL